MYEIARDIEKMFIHADVEFLGSSDSDINERTCTPYQTQAIAERFKTGHKDPQMPKEARQTTGKEI